MKKKFISLLICLCCILPCFCYGIFGDEITDTLGALFNWVGLVSYQSTFGTVNRFLCKSNDVHIGSFERYTNSDLTTKQLYIYVYGPEFDTYGNGSDFETWTNENILYINTVVNGNLQSSSSIVTWTTASINYKDVSGNSITKYIPFYSIVVNRWIYNPSALTNGYQRIIYTSNQSLNNVRGFDLCYRLHGVFGTLTSEQISSAVYSINNTYRFAFLFGSLNTSGDQRTYDTDGNIQTINQHPHDVFNTYEVNRTAQNSTVSTDDNYILPDAFDFEGAVIQNSDLRYQDYTYNTEYNVSNITNYYGTSNDSGDNGGNGSINNSGVTITVEEGAMTQTQTQYIDENAINVTVNNNNSVNNDVANTINNIIGDTQPQANTFQQAIQNINNFATLGSTFATLAGSFLSFLPAWVTSLIGICFALVLFMIVMRIIHLFI